MERVFAVAVCVLTWAAAAALLQGPAQGAAAMLDLVRRDIAPWMLL